MTFQTAELLTRLRDECIQAANLETDPFKRGVSTSIAALADIILHEHEPEIPNEPNRYN